MHACVCVQTSVQSSAQTRWKLFKAEKCSLKVFTPNYSQRSPALSQRWSLNLKMTSVSLRLLSFQWHGAGVHDRHCNRVHAALPQTGAHAKTLPRYHPYVSPLVSLLSLSVSLSLLPLHTVLSEITCIPSAFSLSGIHVYVSSQITSVSVRLLRWDLKPQLHLVVELPWRTTTESACF